ncbi:MAG: 30S ribosomal protein S9 [Bacteroidetes bacterium]|jgi:small subunit ribosomal protein S9|nr:30S ribosomal protein S9 [Bacteroidota bacterium]
MEKLNTIGRRKRSVARVYLADGSGAFVINDREADTFLNNDVLRMKVRQPFQLLQLEQAQFDIRVNVAGGGINGQAEAIRLGIARALEQYNPEHRGSLKKAGMLSVDSRQVERKKYGKPKARKSFQFSKR